MRGFLLKTVLLNYVYCNRNTKQAGRWLYPISLPVRVLQLFMYKDSSENLRTAAPKGKAEII
jgi:hypothetical protein